MSSNKSDPVSLDSGLTIMTVTKDFMCCNFGKELAKT